MCKTDDCHAKIYLTSSEEVLVAKNSITNWAKQNANELKSHLSKQLLQKKKSYMMMSADFKSADNSIINHAVTKAASKYIGLVQTFHCYSPCPRILVLNYDSLSSSCYDHLNQGVIQDWFPSSTTTLS